jgi:hemoglobin
MQQDGKDLDIDVTNLYERVGGTPFFIELVDRFYTFVENEPLIRHLYPEDLGPGKIHLAHFLAQYWGGPPQYSEDRGHPRLRNRHMRFSIGKRERDVWVAHMTNAMKSMEITPDDAKSLTEYLENTASLLINQDSGS